MKTILLSTCVALAATAVSVEARGGATVSCDLHASFRQPDERGTKTVQVFEGDAEASTGGTKPLVFISDLKVNTDGTRISYKVDDPHAKNGAINNILNAMHAGHTIAEFETLAQADWQPLVDTWRVLSKRVIEANRKTGKPCVGAQGFMVSMTADVSQAGGWSRVGDCDQSKWLDALTIPGLVLPGGSPFFAKGVKMRDVAVVMPIAHPERLTLGIVGDSGPADELGEASVEMNRMLNALAPGDIPKNAKDAENRFQGPSSIIIVFPGADNRVDFPVTPERVATIVKAKFESWGGPDRLAACLKGLRGHH